MNLLGPARLRSRAATQREVIHASAGLVRETVERIHAIASGRPERSNAPGSITAVH